MTMKFSAVCKYGLAVFCLWTLVPGNGVSQQSMWRELGNGRSSAVYTSAYIVADEKREAVCAIRFEVLGEPLHLDEITVHFSNSQSIRVVHHSDVGSNSVSQAFALPGSRRQVRGVDLVYSPHAGASGVSNIKMWGKVIPGEGDCPR